MRTVRDAKAMAKTLRAELLARTQTGLTHSECLEIVARQFGVDNWNVLAALMESASPSPAWRTAFAAATTIPVLRIFSESSAIRFYVEFWRSPWISAGPRRAATARTTARSPAPAPQPRTKAC